MSSVAGAFRGGEGPPLVLLHSGFSTWVEWRSALPALTAAHEVIAPTLPGSDGGPPLELHGTNMLGALADHVEELIDEAGWDGPVALAGSSSGGVVALELAARGRAGNVVALAPPWPSGPGLPYYMALFAAPMASLRLTEPVHGRIRGTRHALGLLLHGSTSPVVIEPEDAAAMLRSFGRFPLLDVARRSGLSGPGMPQTGLIHCAVSLVWGGGDLLVPRWMWRRWEQALPAASVLVLPGFPHVPHLRDPERIANLILDATAAAAE